MPIYEFTCVSCGAAFEELVRNSDKPICPQCASPDVRRLLSRFAVHSSTPGLGGAAAKSCSTCSSSSCATCH